MAAMDETPIYLDAHATTPVDPRVLEAMLPYFTREFGNAASRNHAFGWRADSAVEEARERVAAAIGASAKEIVFTSGATESNNLAILGAAEAARAGGRGDGVVTSAIEHPAVLDPCRQLAKRGFRVTVLPVDEEGLVDPDALAGALDRETALVSIMTANNEVGTVEPIRDLVRVTRERSGALFHTDAVQALGKLEVDVRDSDVDLLSLSGHKIHGPKGIGALRVRRRPLARLAPIVFGGGHERGLRSGTLNVPGIVGLGKAAELAAAERNVDATRMKSLRDRLLLGLRAGVPDLELNGHAARRLPNNLNVSFPGVESEDLLREIPEIAVSTGAACSSASLTPSHVIAALGLGEARAQTSVRFGLTRFTTEDDIERATAAVLRGVRALRETKGTA
ncbi:MAG: cysteine desulfurase [Gemmatimonadetes bacterium]|nr:cysteine desulfurase [Gemmatimonadota bacterium]